jgi:hypothetical protein
VVRALERWKRIGKQFRHEHGLEALEQRFDEAKLNFAFQFRESVDRPNSELFL